MFAKNKCTNLCAIVAVLAGLVLIIIAVASFWLFPYIVQQQVKDKTALRNGTEQYDRWVDLPINLTFKVYFFTVENPDDVLKGEKPRMKERGPYIYTQARHKYDIKYDKFDQTYTYLETQKFYFDSDASYPLKDDDYVTLLNVPMNTVLQIAEDSPELASLLPGLNLALNKLFGNQFFFRIKVKDVLFEGYKFCQDYNNWKWYDIASKVACEKIAAFLTQIKQIERTESPSGYVFSFFSYKLHSAKVGPITVESGEKDYKLLGNTVAWNRLPYTPNWNGGHFSKCNTIHGTDATIFQPLLEKGQTLSIFNTDICRSIDITFTGESSYKDIKSFSYSLEAKSLRAPSIDNGDECYCINKTTDWNDDHKCLKDGTIDLYSCQGAPVILSLPHFLFGDSSYLNSTIGLDPVFDKHKTYVQFEPTTGTPLIGTKRIQLNMFVRPVKNVLLTKNIHRSLMPILWVDEGVELNDTLLNLLYSQFLNVEKLLTYVQYGLFIVAGVIIIVAILILVCSRPKKEVMITLQT